MKYTKTTLQHLADSAKATYGLSVRCFYECKTSRSPYALTVFDPVSTKELAFRTASMREAHLILCAVLDGVWLAKGQKGNRP